ncbi:MAG TPA: tripartite tricarboxylate transporter substrate-binding protein, partial [Ramlibacter sp.]|nr:tripartite tricarboxylate transporter substrate-binding protein [Ramlibacter sp.]
MTMNNMRRRAHLAMLALAAFAPLAALAQAPANPGRAITLIVPFPAGGPTDAVARAVTQQMATSLAQTIVVENKPGAAGNIGAAAVARAAPDGYTLLAGAASLSTSPHLFKNLGYDPMKDLAPVAMLATAPVFIWVDSRSPIKTTADLVAQMKARPGQFNYSSSAPATLAHLGSLRFLEAAGAQATHINYKGSAQAITDFLGGVFPVYFEVAQPLVPHLKAGKVRALAVVASKRSALMPDVPSIAEAGYAGIDVAAFINLMAP